MRLLKISFFVVILAIFNSTFALDAPKNITLDKAYEDKLEIFWDTAS
jgi:hypothetical protein